MTSTKRFSPEMRERTFRFVSGQETENSSQWSCIEAIAPKIGGTSQTLILWVKQTEVDQGRVDCVTNSDRKRIKSMTREFKEVEAGNAWLKINVCRPATQGKDPAGHPRGKAVTRSRRREMPISAKERYAAVSGLPVCV